MRYKIYVLELTIVFTLFLAIGLAWADDTLSIPRVVPELRATRVNPSPPVIDGNLDDEVWHNNQLEFARDFIQREPDEGKPATESTLVAVVYDDDALYFAFWCFDDEPDKIDRQLVRRDRWGESDVVTVRLDPYHDHQTGYRFDVSAAGVMRDCRLYNDTNDDYSWDGVWESGVKAQPWGWSAEIKIPFHCLRFADKPDQTWGMNVTRYISRRNESPWWAFSPSKDGGFVSKFGHLTGLTGIKPSRHLEILPYAVSGLETEPKDPVSNPDGRDYLKNTGFDLKYGLASNLILDATINPDFGQVELDQPVLNLSAYETYYEEKRPFFVEGANLFDTDYSLFYSRRIGRSPRGDIEDEDYFGYDPEFEEYTHYPKSTTILGAAKLTGKLGGGTSIAFLNAVTQKEIAKYITTSGANREAVVEPMANYSVLRLQQDVLSNSNVGGIFTLAAQDRYNPISTGGVDWRLLTPNGVWGFSGQTIYSRVDNENTGYGLEGEFEKVAGKHVCGSIGINIKSPQLDLNRIGYLSRNNSRSSWIWLQYRTNEDWWVFRNTYHNLNGYAGWNYDNYNIDKGWNYNTYIDFVNNWSFGGGFDMQFAEYFDLETRGNGPWKRPSSWGWWANLSTDPRKKISITLNPGGGDARYGHWWAHYTGVTFRPAGNLEFSGGVNYIRSFHQIIWVENEGDSSIFADMNQDELVLSLTAGITLTRDLSVQLSGQGYISGIDYEKYRRYVGGENYEPYSLDNKDFNYTALNSTFILRWEYRPGSTLYVVWTRAMSETNDAINNLEFSRDVKNLFSQNAENVFLIKISYWWSL
jgi:hypothetical protein